MELTVIVDNNTYIDKYFLAEPALSFYMEDAGTRLLFDAGYSDVFLRNVGKMDVELEKLTHIVISHGHNDHTGGLSYLSSLHFEQKPILIGHPNVFEKKMRDGISIGAPERSLSIKSLCDLRLTKEPYRINPRLIFLGEIPRRFSFEANRSIGERMTPKGWEEDFLLDDSALVYSSERGLYIITGCSHSGICNIISYAKEICQSDRIISVIGGFHLFDSDNRTDETIRYLREQQIEFVYPCHCTSLDVKAALYQNLNVEEVGVGLRLQW